MPPRVLPLLALVGVLLLAGCVDETPTLSAGVVPEDAPSEAGSGDHALLVLVTDEPGGPPVPRAEVRVAWSERDALALRTDAQGVALARVPPDARVLVIASAPGRTVEQLRDVATGPAGERTQVSAPLYLARIAYDANVTLSPADGSLHRAGMGEFRWLPQEAAWGATPEAREQYLRRLVSLRVAIEWTNGPTTGFGDLGVGAGATEGRADAVADSGDAQAQPTTHREEMFLGYKQVHDLGWRESPTLFVGPGTGSGYLAPLGLPVAVRVEAEFDGDLDKTLPVPGPGVVPLVALAGLAGLWLRRLGAA